MRPKVLTFSLLQSSWGSGELSQMITQGRLTKAVHSRKVRGCLPGFSDSQILFKTMGNHCFFFFKFNERRGLNFITFK